MEVQYWEGGLTRHEVDAIEEIKKYFSGNTSAPKQNKAKDFSALKQVKTQSSGLPWKGYAGFRFVDVNSNYEGEFDLVIVTHCNVLIIELKHWNGKITSTGDTWFQNDEDRGRSPVFITRNKKQLLERKLDKYKNKFTNKGFRPRVDFLIVMTGNADLSSLSEDELLHVRTLKDFLQIKNENVFNKLFRPHPGSKVLNKDFHLFDELFGGNNVRSKSFRINGYIVEDSAIFKHPKEVYQEFIATSARVHTDQALVRRWNFDKIDDNDAKTPDGRYRLISREYTVLEHIKITDEDLYQDCLNHKRPPEKENITVDYAELFSILPSNKRLNQFIEQHAKQMKEDERLSVVLLLLDKFSRLHRSNIAHRDLGDHSIWISPGKKIKLSGFISAYFARSGTVGDVREILSVQGSEDLASEYYPIKKLTAFEQDTRSLAVLSWHIMQAERISKASLEKFPLLLQESNKWYDVVFKKALSDQPFVNVTEFLEEFNKESPDQFIDFSFSIELLEKYVRDINHSRQYREDDGFITEESDKEVYISNGQLVKAWLNIQYQNNDSVSRYVHRFLEKISQLKSLSPDYIPTIRDFGIALKTSSLYMVSDYIEGPSWNLVADLDLKVEEKLELIDKLIHAIEHLHGLNYAHGDLHPDNIKITLNEDKHVTLYLLDLLDYTSTGKSNLNYRYCPDSAEGATEIERDNFAVMRLASELLGIEWGQDSEEYPEIAQCIKKEISDRHAGFVSLERFKDSLKPKSATKFVKVIGKESEKIITIYPDNGELYIQFREHNRSKNQIEIRLTGVGGSFTTVINPVNKQLQFAYPPRENDEVSKKNKDTSYLSIFLGLTIIGTKNFDLNALNKALCEDVLFVQALEDYCAALIEKESFTEELVLETEQQDRTLEDFQIDNVKISQHDDSDNGVTIRHRPNIRKLWNAILDTEIEALPYVNVLYDYRKNTQSENQIVPKIEEDKNTQKTYLYYEVDADSLVLDRFRNDDIVDAVVRDLKKDRDVKLGKIDIQKSNESRLCFNQTIKNTWILKDSPTIYLQSKQNKASFQRRKKALERLLDGESVIEQLPEYFDENCTLSAIKYDIKVNDADFKRYDRDGVSLNEAQREAFKRLLQNGPLSLLQGPPGTGKTEFISAFVHFLFEKQNVRNILLVSQSHEAVNTAAERIRRHCRRLETDIDIVRFSNRESAISTELQDVFSQNLVISKREILKATQMTRICSMGQTLGLQSEYLQKRVETQLELGEKVKRLARLRRFSVTEENVEEYDRFCRQLESDIRQVAENKKLVTDIEVLEIEDIVPVLISDLDMHYGIQPKESLQATKLIDLTVDMQEALSNERVSYDEFLARSRQLVVGTCVGMGQGHIGIGDNIYDWVIIDEAARSISSELAIAMQSGTRILLVGDHKQLPPLYSTEHKVALARRLAIKERGEELDQILGSDFERVFESHYGSQVCAILQTQYRMAPPIGNLVSQCFYDGKLQNGKQNSDIPDIYSTLPSRMKSTVTWLDTIKLPNAYHKDDKGSLMNQAEADLIIKLLQDLSANREFNDSETIRSCISKGEAAIGVICMYGEQKRLIRKKFNEKDWSDTFKQLVKIDTVDSYQGKENHIIILSITRNDKQHSTGFLKLPNRINVALSRAMDKLIIVGATSMWRGKNQNLPLGKVLKMIEESADEAAYSVKVEQVKSSNIGHQIVGKNK